MVKLNPIIGKCKNVLEEHYGKKFQGLILYGSMAQKKADRLSDIDLLVLLSQPFNYFTELRRITDLLYPLQLDSARLISAKPADKDAFERGEIQLYRNAKQDGIVL